MLLLKGLVGAEEFVSAALKLLGLRLLAGHLEPPFLPLASPAIALPQRERHQRHKERHSDDAAPFEQGRGEKCNHVVFLSM